MSKKSNQLKKLNMKQLALELSASLLDQWMDEHKALYTVDELVAMSELLQTQKHQISQLRIERMNLIKEK